MKRVIIGRWVAVALMMVLLIPVQYGCKRAKGDSIEAQIDTKVVELRDMAELGTVEYTVTKVIKANDNTEWYKIGDRKVLITTTAYLKAGIDLSGFSRNNIRVDRDRNSVVVTLPHAKLLTLNMPPEKIRLQYQNVGVLRRDFTADEINHLLVQGERSIRSQVPKLGLLEDAERNATEFFMVMLREMGFEEVTIKFV